MFLNKTTKYALSILAYMAHDPMTQFSSEFLHEKLNIPRRYLRQLLTDLSKHGFITSSRGRSGGFRLSKDAKKLSVADVIDSLEGLENYESCFFGIENCINDKPCAMHKPWFDTREALFKTLRNTTLYDLGKDIVIKF